MIIHTLQAQLFANYISDIQAFIIKRKAIVKHILMIILIKN